VTTSLDTQLINDFLNGDVNSFNRLAWRWQDRLYRFAYRYLLNEDDAKEVVQMALIKTYKNLKKLQNPERFSSWVFQITVNLCKDHLKNPSRNRFVSLDEEVSTDDGRQQTRQELMAIDVDPENDIHLRDIGDIVKKTIARLPDEQRIVIIMKEYQGLKFKEIAEILDCPINTVKSRMYYGLQQMHKILKSFNIDKEVLFNEM